MRVGPRNRLAGACFKPPSAAVVKSPGRERRRKGVAMTKSGIRQQEDCKEPLLKCRKQLEDAKTAVALRLRDRLRGNLSTGGAASGMRGGLSLPTRRLSGTWEPESSMLTEKPQVEIPRGREYGYGGSGTEQRGVAMKSPIEDGANALYQGA
jgi:hypothetical protein